MTFIKKLVYTLLSIFLLHRSTIRIEELWNAPIGAMGMIYQVFISILLVVYITGVFAFPGFVFPTHKILPNRYFYINNPVRLKHYYKRLGVKYFRAILLLVFWGRKRHRRSFFDGTRQGILNFIDQTKQAEFGHLGALVVLVIVAIALGIRGHTGIALIMTLLNFAGNGYPVVLQRYHRMRIGRLVSSDSRL